jgi:hypothetical protein
MVKFTASLEHFLWTNYRDKFALIKMGHTELFTDEIQKEYLDWCKTDEGKEYLEGGKHYHEPR